MNPQAEYTWSANPTAPCSALYGVPVVTDRYVSFNGSTEVRHEHYAYTTAWSNSPSEHWTSKQTVVTTTDMVRSTSYTTTYTYLPSVAVRPPNTASAPTSWDPVENTIVYKDTNGAVLKTVYKTWANPRLLTSMETQYPSGQADETKWSYNGREMQIEQDDYNFGATGVGSLLRKVVTNYEQFPNASWIVNRPCQIITYDSTGINRAAETDLFYDNGATATPCGAAGTPSVVSAGGASLTGHDLAYSVSSINARGNLTQKTQWLNTGTSPYSRYSYDETGQVRSITDPNGNVTSYSYTDSFVNTNSTGFSTTAGAPPSGKVTNAYLTQISRPSANGVAHISTFSYGYNNGEPTRSTDENSQPATFKYNDSLGRLTETDYPDTGQSSISYNDSVPSVTTAKLLTTSSSMSTTVTLDGLNHATNSQLTTDPEGVTSSPTVYDGLGRTYQQYNPTRCSPPMTSCGEATWGYATYTYDGLSRPTSITKPDGSSAAISYSSNCTTRTDEAGQARKSCVDGLGRLTGVWENPVGLNYETDYTYDALGNLTGVNQKGSNNANARVRAFVYDSLSRLTSATNPESGVITYTYDATGNVLTKTAPAPNQTGTATVITTYAYDSLNRVTSVTYSDGITPANYYRYDVAPSGITANLTNVVGRLVWSYNAYGGGTSGKATAAYFSYDAMGRTIREWEQTPSVSPNGAWFCTSYDLAGNLISINPPGQVIFGGATGCDPAGKTISYNYDSAGRITSVNSNFSDAQHPATLYSVDASVGYVPDGSIRKATFGNGLTETHAYNQRFQPCRSNYNSSGTYLSTCNDAIPSGNILDLHPTFNAGSTDNGNVATWSATGALTFSRTYSYDALNRIQSMTDTASNQACKGMSWTIDAWGNMTNQAATAGTCYGFASSVGTNNQLQSGYQYDAAGNLTFDGTHHYTYDAEDRIIQVDSGSTATYIYNENGQRARKSTGSSFTEYYYAPDGTVQIDYDGSSWSHQYIYAGSQFVAEYKNSTTQFIHADHLGSTRLVTGVNQSVLDSIDYIPYGLQVSGDTATGHKFTGKERDAESGLDDFDARYYGSSLGRFMTPDEPLEDQHTSDPQSWNLYSYVRNNPLRYTDPTGNACVQGSDGKYHDDNSGGETCAQVDQNNKNAQPSATVTATPGSLPAAFGLNAFFALDNMANAWFSPLFKLNGTQAPSYMQDTPLSDSGVGKGANAAAFVGTLFLGPGEVKTATGVIRITEHAAEAMAEHGVTTAMAEKAVQVGEKFLDPKNDSTVYVVRKGMASGKDLAVAVSNKTGKLTTVMVNNNAVRPRFIPVK